MRLSISGLPTQEVERLRAGGTDAHGQPPLVRVAEGAANPCRHCLGLIREGDEKLVLAHRPFPTHQPYAEVGPIFLHRHACERFVGHALPGWFAFMDPAVVRGYDTDDWIRYETGRVVRGSEIEDACRAILTDPGVAYVHVRSKFGCFQCRVDRQADWISTSTRHSTDAKGRHLPGASPEDARDLPARIARCKIGESNRNRSTDSAKAATRKEPRFDAPWRPGDLERSTRAHGGGRCRHAFDAGAPSPGGRS